MNNYQWLNRGRKLHKEIELLEAQKEKLLAVAEYSGVSTGEVVAGSAGNSSEKRMVAYTALCEAIDSRLTELYEVQAEIVNAIGTVPESWKRQLLHERFIDNLPLDKLGYSTPGNAKRALQNIADELKLDI